LTAIWRTTDGGLSWTTHEVGYVQTLKGVAFLNSQLGLAVGHMGMFRTVDGGEAWERPLGGMRPLYSSVSFSDPLNGWCVDNNNTSLLYTIDGGENWTSIPSPSTMSLFQLRLASESEIWVIGLMGTVMRTVNGGEEWIDLDVPVIAIPEDLAIYENHVWIVGSQGMVIHSEDSGANWELQETGITSRLNSIDFVDSDHGIIAGDEQSIFTTDNGGTTWTQQSIQAGSNFTDVDLIDVDWGYAVSDDGYVLRTEDGGVSWTELLHVTTADFSTVQFVDRQSGWAMALVGGIFYTQDGGETWEEQSGVAFYGATDMCIVPPFAWAVGGSVVARYTPPLDVDKDPVSIPREHSLSAYPNPFNSTTTLAYDIPQAGETTLQVFDITGRLVETLKDRVIPAGTYSIQFDGQQLASGVYFIRLESNQQQDTQKIVLIK